VDGPNNIVESPSRRKAKQRRVPLRADGGDRRLRLPRGVFQLHSSSQDFHIPDRQTNPQYVFNIGIGIDTGNSEWTSELRPGMYYHESSLYAMHASYG
jgi:hypothetical protein